MEISTSDLKHLCSLGNHKKTSAQLAHGAAPVALRYDSIGAAKDVANRGRRGHGLALGYKQAHDALQANRRLSTQHNGDSYGYIRLWLQALATTNAGSVVDTKVDEDGRLQQAFVSLKAWPEDVARCVPVVALDACHSRTETKCTMFLAS